MSVASEYDHAEQVVADVALLHDMAAGRLDEQRVKEAAQVLLEHRRHELPSVSIAVAARLLGVSRTTVESWRQAGVLTSAAVRRRRHEVTIDSLVRLQVLQEELRGSGKAASFGTTYGGPLKTPPTMPTECLPRHCTSCMPENSAMSTCLQKKTLTGHAVSLMIQPPGRNGDGSDCAYAAGPPADRVHAARPGLR